MQLLRLAAAKQLTHVVRVHNSCPPSEIKILAIDLGKEFLVGTSALLPPKKSAVSTMSTATSAPQSTSFEPIAATKGASTTPSNTVTNTQPVPKPASSGTATPPQTFFNLSVKQKAVYQPTLKHRRWLERRRMETMEGGQSISDIESHLPQHRGPNGSVEKYVNARQEMETVLYALHNKPAIKKNAWNAQRAKEQEFRLVADRLLQMVGGSTGAKRQDDNLVIIGISLGDFKSYYGLSSLHTAFCSYLVRLARSLGYIVVVVGENGFYTSKKCPVCQAFVGQVNTRRLYCPHCKSFMHRDELAGHNMCKIIQGHLLDQEWPQYLQPIYADDTLVWAQNKDKNNVKDQDLPECSILKTRSEERDRPTTAKDVSMDEPQDTSQPGRTPVKRVPPDPPEEETPPVKKTIRLHSFLRKVHIFH